MANGRRRGMSDREAQLMRGFQEALGGKEKMLPPKVPASIKQNGPGTMNLPPEEEARLRQKMQQMDEMYQQKYQDTEQPDIEQEARKKALESIRDSQMQQDQMPEEEEELSKLQQLMRANKPRGL